MSADTREVIAKAAFEKAEAERVDDGSPRPADTWDAIHETAKDYWRGYADAILAALAEAGKQVVDAKVLTRYRYAADFGGADSWDGCNECTDRLIWASEKDIEKPRDQVFGEQTAEYYADRAMLQAAKET